MSTLQHQLLFRSLWTQTHTVNIDTWQPLSVGKVISHVVAILQTHLWLTGSPYRKSNHINSHSLYAISYPLFAHVIQKDIYAWMLYHMKLKVNQYKKSIHVYHMMNLQTTACMYNLTLVVFRDSRQSHKESVPCFLSHCKV